MAKKKIIQNAFVRNGLRLKDIVAKTANQQKIFDEYNKGQNIFVSGCPGTGKTFLGLYLALKEMNDYPGKYKQLIILRSVVPSREMGFLPGSAEEKAAIYETPYVMNFTKLFDRSDAYDSLKEQGIVQFVTTSFLRGMTFENSILLVDELQNMQFEELNTVISRIGDNTKVIFSGDFFQNDLNKKFNDKSGFGKFKKILEGIDEFSFIEMGVEDIVRSLLVKKYIISRINYEEKYEPLPDYYEK